MITRIGKKGGKGGSLKFESGFDYYRFEFLRGSRSPTALIQRSGLGTGDFIRIGQEPCEIEYSVSGSGYVNPGFSDFTYPCSNSNLVRWFLFDNGVTIFEDIQPCPFPASAGVTYEVTSDTYRAYNIPESDPFRIEFNGGQRQSDEGIGHKGSGIIKITQGAVIDATQSGERGFTIAALKKIN